mmetsp:Transcript_123039/g.383032  ORF Transcript_123039/g.383032 Transcript_123039/m.383032 type:complete len:214 (-) Transcript_123039:183-824(-)
MEVQTAPRSLSAAQCSAVAPHLSLMLTAVNSSRSSNARHKFARLLDAASVRIVLPHLSTALTSLNSGCFRTSMHRSSGSFRSVATCSDVRPSESFSLTPAKSGCCSRARQRASSRWPAALMRACLSATSCSVRVGSRLRALAGAPRRGSARFFGAGTIWRPPVRGSAASAERFGTPGPIPYIDSQGSARPTPPIVPGHIVPICIACWTAAACI